MTRTFTGRELRSTIDDRNILTLSLARIVLDKPGDDEVIVRVEAAPINPSDLGLLLGPADLSTLRVAGDETAHRIEFDILGSSLPGVIQRVGQTVVPGNEGAGLVVAAGSNVSWLEGRRVAMLGGGMYADYRKIPVRDVVPLPPQTTAAEGASLFINPLTALGFVQTALSEGHKAIVHTAAASNLGQMLVKICRADGIPLINIVRSAEQAALLRRIGAQYVLDSTDDDFAIQLDVAIEATDATIVFDAVGGGRLGSDILQAMERVAIRRMHTYSRYGSDVLKQLYIYGALDLAPVPLNRGTFGFQWNVGGWLLFTFLSKTPRDVVERLRRRVLNELTTTFVSHYTQVIGLAEVLQPDVLRSYERKATGKKFLIDPSRG